MKKHVLLLTGRDALSAVERVADSAPIPVRIHVCDIDVASFLSVDTILDELSGSDLRDVSMILVPGSVKGDLSLVEEGLSVPCFKGPKNVSDLSFVLDLLSRSDLRLSMETPADEFLEEKIRDDVELELSKAYSSAEGSVLKIGGKNPVFIGTGVMHVLAEIPDAPSLSDSEVKRIAAYYVDSGASIVDLGMVYGVDHCEEIPRLVDAVRSAVDVPVSVDSVDQKEILAAVDSGVDLVLSIDSVNRGIVDSIDVPVVIIPRNEGGVPKDLGERIALVGELMQELQGVGFDKYIVDLVLDPPGLGLMNSLQAFYGFRKEHPRTPMLLGCGNVTELLDADSIGVNALLASIASELGIGLLFTTEASNKTKGCVRELSMAAKMMYLAKKKRQAPKDLGLDLLSLKDKRGVEVLLNPREAALRGIESKGTGEYGMEDSSFSVRVLDGIEVVYYRDDEPRLKFTGSRADSIYKEIIFRGLVKSLYHAAYLGRELGKAEIALRTGKNYVQDEDLF